MANNDRYLVGNRFVSCPTEDTTKTIEEYVKESKENASILRQALSEANNYKIMLSDSKEEIKSLNEVIAKLKKQAEPQPKVPVKSSK